MLSNASMQQKKQNTTRLGSALTGSPSEPRSHRSITSDWQSTEVSDSTVFERKALHPQPISCQEDRLWGYFEVVGLLWTADHLDYSPSPPHTERMPKRIKHKKRPKDINQLAHYLWDASTKEEIIGPPTTAQISILMAEMGRRGGKIGGKRRLETMTARERQRIAKKAARSRWNNPQKRKPKGPTGTTWTAPLGRYRRDCKFAKRHAQ